MLLLKLIFFVLCLSVPIFIYFGISFSNQVLEFIDTFLLYFVLILVVFLLILFLFF